MLRGIAALKPLYYARSGSGVLFASELSALHADPSLDRSLEVCLPFLDERLLAFARRIPWRSKVRWTGEKRALKQGVGGRLPRSVLTRPKTGFGAPVQLWLAGRMGEEIRDLLGSRAGRECEIFDGKAVSALLDDTRAGRCDGAYLVLAIVMTELWMRAFVDPETTAADRAALTHSLQQA